MFPSVPVALESFRNAAYLDKAAEELEENQPIHDALPVVSLQEDIQEQ